MLQHVVEVEINGKTVDEGRPVSRELPLPVDVLALRNTIEKFRVESASDEPLLDVLERIQQQLAMINNGNNLAPGERFY